MLDRLPYHVTQRIIAQYNEYLTNRRDIAYVAGMITFIPWLWLWVTFTSLAPDAIVLYSICSAIATTYVLYSPYAIDLQQCNYLSMADIRCSHLRNIIDCYINVDIEDTVYLNGIQFTGISSNPYAWDAR